MCSHYTALKKREQMEKYFRARGLPIPPQPELYPFHLGEFIRRPPEWDSGDEAVPAREVEVGRWGMIPPGTRADGLKKAERVPTFNAKSETIDRLWTFRNAWSKGQRCVIPAEAIYEPDHRQETKERFSTDGPISTRFTRADGSPLGLAGLWDRYRDADGTWRYSYTMITINADAHPLFRNYHEPGKEKRMVVFLPEDAFRVWLETTVDQARTLLLPFPADQLVAEVLGPYPTKRRSAPKGASNQSREELS